MALYSDINQFTPTNSALVADIDSIYESIGNILSTPKNTRLFLPEFGSDIENILFDLMDPTTKATLYDAVIVAIQQWEPRVTLNYARSTIVADYDNHQYNVTLVFSVKGLEANNYYVYQGILQQMSR